MYLASFGAGFLTSLTPCVYPMIPITLGIFGARGKDVSRARRLLLATAYVVGMGLTYSILGVTFAMLGGSAGALLANPFVVIPIVILFVAIYFLRPRLPWMRTIASPEKWFLWVSLALIPAGLVIGAAHLTFGGSTTDKIRKGVGVVLVLAGALGAWTWKLTPKQ